MANCKYCNNEIIGKRNDAIFCSNACKVAEHRTKQNLSVRTLNDGTIIHQYQNILPQISGMGLGDALRKVENVKQVKNESPLPYVGSMAGGAFIGLAALKLISKSSKSKATISEYFTAIGGGAVLGGLAYNIYKQWKVYKDTETQDKNYQGVALADSATNFGFNNNTYNAQQLNYMHLPTIALTGRISEVIGKNVNANFQAVIYGEAGSGKSHLATIFTKDLGLIGRTLYVTAEEGLTNHVQERLKRYGVTEIPNVEFLPSNDIKRVIEILHRGNYQFVVIDSIQALSPDWKEQLKFTKALRKLNLLGAILLLQVNKGGDARGSTEILHDADVVIEVSNGIAKATKNRFGESLSHEIFNQVPKQSNILPNILRLKTG